jgi:simple sugar transport system substrate-binding protein
MDLAKKVVAGEPVPPRVVTPDKTFDQQQAVAVLPDRKY